MTFIPKSQVQGNDPDDAAIDIEATASGKLKVQSEVSTPIGDLGKCGKYTYDSANKIVTVIEEDLDFVYSIYNQTVDKMLYQINSESFSATVTNENTITYSTEVVGVADSDTLIIFCLKTKDITDTLLLKHVLLELKNMNTKLDTNNKHLKNIYKID
jgi:hypothetical protein